MAAQLRPVLPAMAESINFRFLWREHHLSDYTLVICSHPDEPLSTAVGEQSVPAVQHSRPVHPRPLITPMGVGFPGQPVHRQQQAGPSSGEAPTDVAQNHARGARIATITLGHSCDVHHAGSDCNTHLDKSVAHGAEGTAVAAASRSAGKTRQRKRGASPAVAASCSGPSAADIEHIGPTTRSAKRRQQVTTTATPPVQNAHAAGTTSPSAAEAATGQQQQPRHPVINRSRLCSSLTQCKQLAAAAGAGSKAGQQRNSSNTQAAVEVVDLIGDVPGVDCVTPTAPAAAAAVAEEVCGRQQHNARRTAPVTPRTRPSLHSTAAAAAALSPAAGPSGTPPPSAAVAAAAAAATLVGRHYASVMQQQQQQQESAGAAELVAGASMPAPAAAEAAGPSQPAMIIHRELPVHGAVLSAMSEYFRALIQNWQGAEKRLQMVVQEDEALVAEALIEFMYTGELPSVNHDDMLRLMRLSDKFQVKNCPAACARRFAETPMEDLSLETVCAIFDWPGFLQDAEPFKGVTAKAWSKLLEMFGDLEVAWQDRSRRQQFLELPYKAVRKLIASDDVAVSSENTILVALAEWVEASNRRQLTTDVTALLLGPQHGTSHRELAELVRLQHLTPTFLGSVLKHVSIMNQVATAEALQAAARYATGNEATRNKLHNMPNRQPRFKVLYSPPRARSVVQRLEFTWVLELQTVKAMIDQFRNTKVTVDRYSEPHYFNGFQWQLVLQVLEPPAKQPAAGQAAVSTPAAAVDVFVGTTARIQIGGSQHLPDVLYFQGQLAAREVASGDFTFVNRMESGFVCGTAGWGFRNFLRITDWDNEAALRRFFYDGKIHLRCNIDQCE